MNQSHSNHLNHRALVAILMVGSFACLPPTGLALHLTDGASFQVRHLPMTIHNLAAIIFLISVILHLMFNWKLMVKYILTTVKPIGGISREFVFAALIMMTVLALGLLPVLMLGGAHPLRP